MDQAFKVEKGDRIIGYFGLNKHRNNSRYIDVVIEAKHTDKQGKTIKENQKKLFEMQ